jgi:hypothetical protein
MSSARRSSSGTGSISGSFFNQKPSNNTQKINSHTTSQRTSSNRSSTGRTTSQKKRAIISNEENYIPVLNFTPKSEAEIIKLKSLVKAADELRRKDDIMKAESIFDKANMDNVEKQKQSIKKRTKDLLRQKQLKELVKQTEKLYNQQKNTVDSIKPSYFNNSKLRKHEKLMNGYGKQLNYLYDQEDIINKKLRDKNTVPNKLLKDIKLLNKYIDAENDPESDPKNKYYDDKFFTRKYRKSTRKRGGSRRTRRRKR